jgi:hypothetical protein
LHLVLLCAALAARQAVIDRGVLLLARHCCAEQHNLHGDAEGAAHHANLQQWLQQRMLMCCHDASTLRGNNLSVVACCKLQCLLMALCVFKCGLFVAFLHELQHSWWQQLQVVYAY